MDLFAPVVGGLILLAMVVDHMMLSRRLIGWKRRLNDGNDSSISMDVDWRGFYLR